MTLVLVVAEKSLRSAMGDDNKKDQRPKIKITNYLDTRDLAKRDKSQTINDYQLSIEYRIWNVEFRIGIWNLEYRITSFPHPFPSFPRPFRHSRIPFCHSRESGNLWLPIDSMLSLSRGRLWIPVRRRGWQRECVAGVTGGCLITPDLAKRDNLWF